MTMMDHDLYEAAKRRADKLAPRPDDAPSQSALKAGMFGLIVIGAFRTIDDFAGAEVAWIVTAGLCALIFWLDCRAKWQKNASEFTHAVEYLKTRPGYRD